MGRVSVRDIRGMKCRGEKIPVVTAYDYTSAQIADAAGVPLVLVGDSLGIVRERLAADAKPSSRKP